jgi:C1A family cysteine protease
MDWRLSGKVAPVLNQGTCGSCWAFSGADVLQSALAITNGYSISTGDPTKTVSIQYFIDCDDVYNMGCLGGL